ncbi:hypothetical protein UCRPC4_g06754 [Phaeomoniella chlamydospora]|uniref:Uncharacterized protein n=1 Tax=Phaeomoniella chlamydospora TaxID=158046 RepID=A0A0G2DU07_PHACM|nr:hypothetical protein UCRPC4_g06754 [Phaeomoniella chlamydospora]
MEIRQTKRISIADIPSLHTIAGAALSTLAASFLTPDVNITAEDSGKFDCPVSKEKIQNWVEQLDRDQRRALAGLQWTFRRNYSAPFTRRSPMFAFGYIESEEKTDICRQALRSLKIEYGAEGAIEAEELDEFISTIGNLMRKCREFINVQAAEDGVDVRVFHSAMRLLSLDKTIAIDAIYSDVFPFCLACLTDQKTSLNRPLVVHWLKSDHLDMAIKALEATEPQEPVSMKLRLAIIICTWCKAKHVIKNPQNQVEKLDTLCSEFVKIYQRPEERIAEERFEVLLPDLYKFLEENPVEIDYVTSQIKRL